VNIKRSGFQNRLVKNEMDKLRDLTTDFIKYLFYPDLKAMIPVSGGLDSVTTTCLLVKSLGPKRVVAFHLPHELTPKKDTENFDLAMSRLGIEHYKFYIGDIVKDTIRKISRFKDMNENKYEFTRAEIPTTFSIREAIVLSYGKLEEGNYRAVGALDRAEYLTGNFPKGFCTLDVAPILGMYRIQIRWLAKNLGVPDEIVYRCAEYDAECASPQELFERGEIAQDLFLHLICDLKLSDSEIHELGKRYGVELKQKELDLTRYLIAHSEHKRVLHIPYPKVAYLGINEQNLFAAYKSGEMLFP
jgi:NH3-dependent NAD+ synthetase